MTREELKEHCEKQIRACEMWAKEKGEGFCDKVYAEHKLILELLEQEPPVTPQQKTGHWIEDEEEMECYCSECGKENPSTLNTNYCPNCGIKMGEGEEV